MAIANLMKVVRIHEIGGSDKLHFDAVEKIAPKTGELLIKNHAIGVNFIDTYHRTGLYKLPLPAILGREGAGVVELLGEGVSDFKVGDRVAYVLVPNSYAEYVVAPAWRAIKIPDNISFNIAASAMIQGLTAHYLASSTYALKHGDKALVLAAAGGTGQLLLQIAKLRGAHVIATTSSHEKAAILKKLGADDIIITSEKKIDEEVKRLTNGTGVNVAYDSVGKATWEQSINSISPLGYLVLYGNASGPVPPLDPLLLSEKGSLFLTRPSLGNYIPTPEAYHNRTKELFQWLSEGKVTISNPTVFPLSEAAKAHELLESGKSVGKIILTP